MLYETARTRVSRIWPLGCATSLIRKEPLGPRAVERAHHEARVLRRLSSVPGVVRLAGGWTGDELVFEDAGGETLASVIGAGRIDIEQSLAIALELAGIVAGVHRAGVLHKEQSDRAAGVR